MAVLILDHEYSDVHKDNEHVNAEKLPHDPRGPPLPRRRPAIRRSIRGSANDIERLPDIQAREDEFLESETGHLDLLDVFVRFGKARALGGVVGSEEDDDCRDVEDEAVDDDHPLHALEEAVAGLAENDVQAGVKNETLPCDHHGPADAGDDEAGDWGCWSVMGGWGLDGSDSYRYDKTHPSW